VIHSLCIYFITKIAYTYFAEEKETKEGQEKQYDESRSSKAQIIAFILVSNRDDRFYWTTMYNDEIMMLYLLIAIYTTIKNKPI